ncbi:MAG: diversity-generating retroelement protein Avd [Planctomycetes bacterium]|nr:diversity-generating retroelement protein Avd [Planctomycetota bacterium]
MQPELKVISDFYDFMLYLIQRIEKFPRHHRYSLGIAMENRLQTILGLLIRARYSSDKQAWLDDANIELDILRFQVRLATDLKAMAVNSQGHAVKLMQGVGAQIGGWSSRSRGRRREAVRPTLGQAHRLGQLDPGGREGAARQARAAGGAGLQLRPGVRADAAGGRVA